MVGNLYVPLYGLFVCVCGFIDVFRDTVLCAHVHCKHSMNSGMTPLLSSSNCILFVSNIQDQP